MAGLIVEAQFEPSGDFAVANAKHIAYKDGRLTDYMPVKLTQAEYDALVASGEVNEKTPYFIVEEG